MYYSDILWYVISIILAFKSSNYNSLIGLIVYLITWTVSYLPSGGSVVVIMSFLMIDIVITPINYCSNTKVLYQWIGAFLSLIFILPLMLTNSLYIQLYLAIIYYSVFVMVVVKIIAIHYSVPDYSNMYLVNEEMPLIYINTVNLNDIDKRRKRLSYLFIYSLYCIAILAELISCLSRGTLETVRGYEMIMNSVSMNIYVGVFTFLFTTIGFSIMISYLIYYENPSNIVFSCLILIFVVLGSTLGVFLYIYYMGNDFTLKPFLSPLYSSITLAFFILYFLDSVAPLEEESDSESGTIYSNVTSVSPLERLSNYSDAESVPMYQEPVKHTRKRSSSAPQCAPRGTSVGHLPWAD